MVEEQTDQDIKVEDFYPASSVIPISEFIEAVEGEPNVTPLPATPFVVRLPMSSSMKIRLYL